jgi:hypothetical protein
LIPDSGLPQHLQQNDSSRFEAVPLDPDDFIFRSASLNAPVFVHKHPGQLPKPDSYCHWPFINNNSQAN